MNNPHPPRSFETPGNIAVWILIWAELAEFALFFLAFLIVKSHYPEVFSEGPQRLNTLAATLNTLTLLTSSFFMARAIAAIKSDQPRQSLKWFWLTLAAGAIYCGIKAWEYHWNAEMGLNIRTNMFFSTYYYLTFNHLLHVLIGMCSVLFVTLKLHFGGYDKDNYEGLESAASYWHMIDLAWIIIFPLVYVLR